MTQTSCCCYKHHISRCIRTVGIHTLQYTRYACHSYSTILAGALDWHSAYLYAHYFRFNSALFEFMSCTWHIHRDYNVILCARFYRLYIVCNLAAQGNGGPLDEWEITWTSGWENEGKCKHSGTPIENFHFMPDQLHSVHVAHMTLL